MACEAKVQTVDFPAISSYLNHPKSVSPFSSVNNASNSKPTYRNCKKSFSNYQHQLSSSRIASTDFGLSSTAVGCHAISIVWPKSLNMIQTSMMQLQSPSALKNIMVMRPKMSSHWYCTSIAYKKMDFVWNIWSNKSQRIQLVVYFSNKIDFSQKEFILLYFLTKFDLFQFCLFVCISEKSVIKIVKSVRNSKYTQNIQPFERFSVQCCCYQTSCSLLNLDVLLFARTLEHVRVIGSDTSNTYGRITYHQLKDDLSQWQIQRQDSPSVISHQNHFFFDLSNSWH